MKLPAALVAAAVVLAGTAGFLASVAIGQANEPPTETVTVDVGTGAQGPPGPKGDPGTPGAESCPAPSKFKAVRINTAGGHVTIWTCVAEP